MKYCVEFSKWIGGSGYSYTTSIAVIEKVNNTNGTTAKGFAEDWCENAGDTITIRDNETFEIVDEYIATEEFCIENAKNK